ncbi:MAG: hypothetical protein C0600_05505 [Ignavibacteria bacterium]|nr:MAG: hypothetical protein C0600_05505 [Ignavibacteria bacterium]
MDAPPSAVLHFSLCQQIFLSYFRGCSIVFSMVARLMRLSFILPVCFLITSVTVSAQSVLLKYDLPTGLALKYKQVEQTSALAQSNDGRSTEIDRQVTRYFTITAENTTADAITYITVQDTAIVDENSEDPRIQRQNRLMQNLLTRKPVQVRQSTEGRVEATQPLKPLEAEKLLGPGATDAIFAQRAAILPVLPDRPIALGMSWKDSRADTLQPNKTLPQFGKGRGIRYLAGSTEYTVAGEETVDGTECWWIRWESITTMEEQILFDRLEEYTEDETISTGEMYIAKENALPVKVDVTTSRESMRAVFGAQTSVIPTSVSTKTTLERISQ